MRKCPVPGCDNGELYLSQGYLTCRQCGAIQKQNQTTGNILWMRNGRVVWAEDDVQGAVGRMEANPFAKRKEPPADSA